MEKGEAGPCDLTPFFSPASSQRGVIIKEVCVGRGGDQTDQGSHLKLSITRWGREARIP